MDFAIQSHFRILKDSIIAIKHSIENSCTATDAYIFQEICRHALYAICQSVLAVEETIECECTSNRSECLLGD